MGGSSDDIEALLVDVTDPGNPTPGILPAIFRNIVERLDARRCAYAVVGRIALAFHEQARFVSTIEIVADFGTHGLEQAAEFARATQARFSEHMKPGRYVRPIGLVLRPCGCETEERLLAEAATQP